MSCFSLHPAFGPPERRVCAGVRSSELAFRGFSYLSQLILLPVAVPTLQSGTAVLSKDSVSCTEDTQHPLQSSRKAQRNTESVGLLRNTYRKSGASVSVETESAGNAVQLDTATEAQ